MSTSQGSQNFPPQGSFSEQSSQFGAPPPKQGGNWLLTCLMVGLGGFLLVLIACGIGGWYLSQNAATLITNAVQEGMVELVENSELSDEDKAVITVEIQRVADAYKSGDITLEQVGSVMEELAKSPLISQAVVFAADEQYIKPSGLGDEEKEEARLTLQRLARGVFEEKIDPESLEEATQYISEKGIDGQQKFKEQVSDDELKKFIAECKKLADDAEIPEEPFKVDIGAEFKKAVDRALQK